jgi:hypothetical protein
MPSITSTIKVNFPSEYACTATWPSLDGQKVAKATIGFATGGRNSSSTAHWEDVRRR